MSTPDRHTIPLCAPCLGGEEWPYVKECLDTNWVSYAGSYVERFEADLQAVTGAKHAVAMNSGTAALHLALLLAGVQPDTEVVMPTTTFVAPGNAVRYCGAWPTFVDVSPVDWQVDVDKLATFLAECRRESGRLFNPHSGRPVSALLLVHLLGGMCDVDRIARLGREYQLPVIEDGAQALGAVRNGRPLGAPLSIECQQPPARLAITSFNGNKIITTGSGGAVFTQSDSMAQQLKHLSTTAKVDPMVFDHDQVGYNYRLTNVAAAMGVAQLQRLAEHVQRKRAIAARYREAFSPINNVVAQPIVTECESTFWMSTLLLPSDADEIIKALNAVGIQCRPLWRPLHQLPMFARHCHADRIEFAQKLYRHGICLPCSVDLTETDQQRVITTLLRLL